MTFLADLIPAARITGAHGLRGQLKAHCLLADASLLSGTLPTQTRAGEEAAPLTISRVQLQAGGIILLTVTESTSRTAAETLKGLTILLPRSALPAAAADEIYLHDLLGRHVTMPDDAPAGSITALKNTGAQDLLELTLPDGTTAFIPAHASFFEDLHANPLVLSSLGAQLLTL